MWTSRVFRLFFMSQALSFVGDGLRSVILPLFVYSLTHSALSVGITYATQAIPLILTSIFGGYLADRSDRKRIMLVSDFGRFATLALLAILAATHALNIVDIYVAVFFLAVLTALFQSCQAPSLAHLLAGKHMTSAVSSLQGAEQTTRILTYTVAGVVTQVFGIVPALAINALAYFISQLYLLFMPGVGPERKMLNAADDESAGPRLLSGFNYVLRHPTLRLFAILSVGLNATGMMETVVTIPWLKQLHHASNAEVGGFFSALSIASIVGVALASRLSQYRFGTVFMILIIMHGLLFIPVVASSNFWVNLVFWCATDLTGAAAATQMISWRIRITPKDKVGRVIGAIRVLILIGSVPSAFLAGNLAQDSVSKVLVLVAVFYVVFGLVSIVPRMRAEAG